jgi:cell division protein FtsZ
MSDQYSSGSVAAVGIGSAGCRIVSRLGKGSSLVDKVACISCDPSDLELADADFKVLVDSPVDQKLTPAMVRGLALHSHSEIESMVSGSKVVFVVAGLGGATGSGLAPVVAEISQRAGAITVGVAVMPFEYEKKMKFYAGISLRRLREAARGVIVIDNDTLLRSSPNTSSLTDVYVGANEQAVRALGSLLAKASGTTVSVGLNKVLGTVLQSGYSILGMSSSGAYDKAEEALSGAVLSISKVAEAKDVSHAVVMLTGGQDVKAMEVEVAVKRLGSLTDNSEMDVEYGVRQSEGGQLQVSLLASGFKSTKYDDYDPLSKVLGARTMDDGLDCALPAGLESLPSFE